MIIRCHGLCRDPDYFGHVWLFYLPFGISPNKWSLVGFNSQIFRQRGTWEWSIIFGITVTQVKKNHVSIKFLSMWDKSCFIASWSCCLLHRSPLWASDNRRKMEQNYTMEPHDYSLLDHFLFFPIIKIGFPHISVTFLATLAAKNLCTHSRRTPLILLGSRRAVSAFSDYK